MKDKESRLVDALKTLAMTDTLHLHSLAIVRQL